MRFPIVFGIVASLAFIPRQASPIDLCTNIPVYSQNGWVQCEKNKSISGLVDCTLDKRIVRDLFGDESRKIIFSGICGARFNYNNGAPFNAIANAVYKGQESYSLIDYNSATGCIEYLKLTKDGPELGAINKLGSLKKLQLKNGDSSDDAYSLLQLHCGRE